MEKLIRIKGPAAALPRPNIDTDVIVRIERLSTIPRAELGRYAFESLRADAQGRADPAFPFNQPRFAAAPILLAGRNFGCGSSREGAVWALAGMGLRCIIAPSFGDIFFNNCFQNGVLPIVLDEATLAGLMAQCAGGAELQVDLEDRRIVRPDGVRLDFDIDPLKRLALLEGLDDIDQTLKRDADIRLWQRDDRARRPWIWAPLAGGVPGDTNDKEPR